MVYTTESGTEGGSAAKQNGYAPSTALIRSRMPHSVHIDGIISARLTRGLQRAIAEQATADSRAQAGGGRTLSQG